MTLPDTQTLLLTGAALAAGIAAGWLHFASLARITDMILEGRLAAVGLQILRLALLGLFLWLCTRGGTPVLVAGAAGIFAGRALALRRVR